MGCNFCDDCSDCTVGGDIDCGAWDPDEHREEHFAYDYDDEYHDKAEDMDVGKEQHCTNCGEPAQLIGVFAFHVARRFRKGIA